MSGSVSLVQSWRADLMPVEPLPARPVWLTSAYENPAEFWNKIGKDLIGAAPGAPRSAVFEWYNLFHELGQRHAVQQRAAHLDYNPSSGFDEVSYAALTERARKLATSWRALGVRPGATVCIVLGSSPTYVTCILAAFYCGATVSIVPPEGPAFVQRAVQGLIGPPKKPQVPASGAPAPLFVVAGTKAEPWLSELEGLCPLSWELDPALNVPPDFEPHRYPANASAVRLFSPLGVPWDTPVALSADQLYLSALRDGVLLLGLEPGQRVAAPGFCAVQYKPGLLFATLAAGATWVDISLDESNEGRLLFSGKIDVLGVCRAVRDWIGNMALPARPVVKRWFRNVAEEDNAVRAWTRFEALMAETGALGSRWLGNSAAGGSILFSAWTSEPARGGLWRAPGLPYALKEPNGTGMPSLADVALLSPTKAPIEIQGALHQLPPSALGKPVIAKSGESDIWITNLGSHRRGTVLPESQIEQLLQVKYRQAVRAAVLVALPRHGEGSPEQVALLVYVRPGLGVLRDTDIKSYLENQLGAMGAPDSVKLLELNPKLLDGGKGGAIDRAACAAQFLSGTAWGKQQHDVFRQLAACSLELERIAEYQRDLPEAEGR